MKKLIMTCLLLPLHVFAAGDIQLDEASVDLTDNASLARGAKLYSTYCLGCHSSKHIRYLNISEAFDLSKEQVLADIAPEGAGIYDNMQTAMNGEHAAKWFGTTPPDLSLIARSRGADWLYSYLQGFYADPKAPTGVNNTVFKELAMPNPLWKLQGIQNPIYEEVDGQKTITGLMLAEPGLMSPAEFDEAVNDLVNFMVYVSEPHQLQRKRMGKYVLLFIFMFTVVAYLLKKEYWKDVH